MSATNNIRSRPAADADMAALGDSNERRSTRAGTRSNQGSTAAVSPARQSQAGEPRPSPAPSNGKASMSEAGDQRSRKRPAVDQADSTRPEKKARITADGVQSTVPQVAKPAIPKISPRHNPISDSGTTVPARQVLGQPTATVNGDGEAMVNKAELDHLRAKFNRVLLKVQTENKQSKADLAEMQECRDHWQDRAIAAEAKEETRNASDKTYRVTVLKKTKAASATQLKQDLQKTRDIDEVKMKASEAKSRKQEATKEAALRKQIDAKQAKLDQANSTIGDQKEKIDDSKERIRDLKEQLKDWKPKAGATLKEREKEVMELKSIIEQLRAKEHTLASEKKGLKARNTRIVEERSDLQERLASMNIANIQLKDDIKTHLQRNNELSREILELENTHAAELKEMSAKWIIQKNKADENEQNLMQHRRATRPIADLNERNITLISELRTTNANWAARKVEFDANEQRVEGFRKSIRQMADQKNDDDARIDELERRLDEANCDKQLLIDDLAAAYKALDGEENGGYENRSPTGSIDQSNSNAAAETARDEMVPIEEARVQDEAENGQNSNPGLSQADPEEKPLPTLSDISHFDGQHMQHTEAVKMETIEYYRDTSGSPPAFQNADGHAPSDATRADQDGGWDGHGQDGGQELPPFGK